MAANYTSMFSAEINRRLNFTPFETIPGTYCTKIWTSMQLDKNRDLGPPGLIQYEETKGNFPILIP